MLNRCYSRVFIAVSIELLLGCCCGIPYYETASAEGNHLFRVPLGEEWALINQIGEVKIDEQFLDISLNRTGDFLARSQAGWKYVHADGSIHAAMVVLDDVQHDLINRAGAIIRNTGDGLFTIVPNRLKLDIEELKQQGVDFSRLEPVGFDVKGQLRLPKDYHLVGYRDEGMVAVTRDNKKGFADRDGTIVIAPKFEDVDSFSDGKCAVMLDGKWGYIDQLGNMIIEPIYTLATPFYKNQAFVFQGRSAFCIGADGMKTIETIYRSSSGFYEGLARVTDCESGKVGFIDVSGNYVIEPQFAAAGWFSEGLARFHFDDGRTADGYIDRSGKIVIELPRSKELGDFKNGLAWVQHHGREGFIDRAGKWIWSRKFGDRNQRGQEIKAEIKGVSDGLKYCQ